MSKSVLISINPKWCELIASGEKTVEVRKTKPKLEPPFKCYIYCTQDKKINFCADNGKQYTHIGNGKVIGEFMCEGVTSLKANNIVQAYYNNTQATCLTDTEIMEYAKGGKLYYWHITDLKIYDKPRKLGEFVIEGDCCCDDCNKCKWLDKGNGYNVEDDCLLPYEYDFKSVKPLKRPPQSWRYVEET